MISIRITILCLLLPILMIGSLHADTRHFQFTSNTGSNATVVLPVILLVDIHGQSLQQGDEVGVFTEDGLCVGAIVYTANEALSITIWGNNEQTQEKDGMEFNDSLFYRVWIQSTNVEYKNIAVRYEENRPPPFRSDGRFRRDALYELTLLQTFPPPPSPFLLSPEEGALDLPISILFQWEETQNTDSYKIQVATDRDFTNIFFERDNIRNTSYQVGNLEYQTTYFWRVAGSNLAGPGEWSVTREFLTLRVPPAPLLLTPVDSAEGLLSTVTFEWQQTERTDNYRLQVATDPDFSNIAIDQDGITATSFDVTDLEYQTEYYWRVSGSNAAGQGEWSVTRNFSTLFVPPAPVPVSPENGAEGLLSTVTFQWEETERSDNYRLQIATDADFSNTVFDQEGIPSTSIEVEDLDYQTVHYWRVSGSNFAGQGAWSVTRNFATLYVPPAPVPLSPENGAEGLLSTVTFQWEETERTDSYHLQIATDAAFSNTVFDQEDIPSTSIEVEDLDYQTIHYWRIRGMNVAGHGEWSTVRNFTTLFVPPAPDLISPEDGAEDVPVTSEFQWEGTIRTDSYRLQVATNASFTNIIFDITEINETLYELTGLNYESTYFWRVSSINPAGQGPWSSTWQFSTPIRFIRFENPSGTTVWQATSVQTISWSVSGVMEIIIEYSTNNGSTWQIVEESVDASTGSYDWSVPETPTTEARLRLTDTEEIILTAISPLFSIYPREIPVQLATGFGDPALVTSYRLFGLPGNNNIPISSVMNGRARSDWTAFLDDGSEENYLIEFDDSDRFTFRPGAGFWILSKNDIGYQSSENAVELNSEHAYEIPLQNGWNIISNPFSIPIVWDSVRVKNNLIDPIWAYNGSFSQSDIFQPYQGYYFYNNYNMVRLSIPYPNSGSISKQVPLKPDLAHRLKFSIIENDISLSGIVIGITEEYEDDIDRFSVIAPPDDFEKATIRMKNGRMYETILNPSPEGYTIDISVRLPKNQNFTIDVNGIESFTGYTLLLVNSRMGKIIDFTDNGQFVLSSPTGKEHFRLIIGHEQYAQDALRAMLPSEVTLAQNYPNPFNPYTTIEYSIAPENENQFVSLEIFNILGQNVRTLVQEHHPAGFYSVEWDARDENGNTVPSGLYIYRLQVHTNVLTRTMLLLK